MKKPTAHFISPEMYGRDELLSMKNIHQDILDSLIQIVNDYGSEMAPQCVFLYGEAGSGKTFLLRQLKCIIDEHEKVLYKNFMFSSSDNLLDLCSQIENGVIPQRAIILADNFNNIIESTENNIHFRLRKLLSGKDSPVLIASGRTIPEVILRYDGAFYDFFRIMHLESLSKEQSMTLIKSIYPISVKCTDELSEVFDVVGKTPEMIQLVMNQLFLGRYHYEDIIAGIIDVKAPYYEALIFRLSPKTRDILIAVLLHGPCSLPEIRRYTNYSSGTIASYLHILITKGYVNKITSGARMGIYRVKDNLMKKWAEKFLSEELVN